MFMPLVLVLIVYTCVVVGDFVPTIKRGHKLHIVVYSILLLSSFIVLILVSLDVDMPSPLEPLQRFLKSIDHLK